MTDLISKLDSVSDHAQRAKNEIHSTLRELWQIVDLLGRDRCGDVVERVRVVQRKAESRVEEQDSELAKYRANVFDLTSQLSSRSEEVDSLGAQLIQVRNRAESSQKEVTMLTEKLKKLDTMRERDGSYKELSQRLVGLLRVATERLELLQRIIAMLSDDRASTSEWRSDIDAFAATLRTLEDSFNSVSTGTEQKLRSKMESLQAELRVSKLAREQSERAASSMQATIDRLQRSSSSSARTQRIVVRDDEGGSWAGILALCVISMCSGAVAVYMLMNSNSGDAPAPSANTAPTGSPLDKYSNFSPATRSPGFTHSKTSPMTYVDSASKTPRGSGTPRLY